MEFFCCNRDIHSMVKITMSFLLCVHMLKDNSGKNVGIWMSVCKQDKALREI